MAIYTYEYSDEHGDYTIRKFTGTNIAYKIYDKYDGEKDTPDKAMKRAVEERKAQGKDVSAIEKRLKDNPETKEKETKDKTDITKEADKIIQDYEEDYVNYIDEVDMDNAIDQYIQDNYTEEDVIDMIDEKYHIDDEERERLSDMDITELQDEYGYVSDTLRPEAEEAIKSDPEEYLDEYAINRAKDNYTNSANEIEQEKIDDFLYNNPHYEDGDYDEEEFDSLAEEIGASRDELKNRLYGMDKQTAKERAEEGRALPTESKGAGNDELWIKQEDGSFVANMDAQKKDYEERHKRYDEKIAQLAEDRNKMSNSDWEGQVMAYAQQNADGTYNTTEQIMDDVDAYEKAHTSTGRNQKAIDSLKEAFPNLSDEQINDYYDRISAFAMEQKNNEPKQNQSTKKYEFEDDDEFVAEITPQLYGRPTLSVDDKDKEFAQKQYEKYKKENEPNNFVRSITEKNKSTNEKAKEFWDTYEMNDAEYESFAKEVVNKNAKGWQYNKISLWPNKEGKYNPETDKWEFIGMKGIPNGQQSTKIEVDRDGNIYEEGKLAYDNTVKTMSGKYDYKIAPSDNAKVSTTRPKQNQSTNETTSDKIREEARRKLDEGGLSGYVQNKAAEPKEQLSKEQQQKITEADNATRGTFTKDPEKKAQIEKNREERVEAAKETKPKQSRWVYENWGEDYHRNDGETYSEIYAFKKGNKLVYSRTDYKLDENGNIDYSTGTETKYNSLEEAKAGTTARDIMNKTLREGTKKRKNSSKGTATIGSTESKKDPLRELVNKTRNKGIKTIAKEYYGEGWNKLSANQKQIWIERNESWLKHAVEDANKKKK